MSDGSNTETTSRQSTFLVGVLILPIIGLFIARQFMANDWLELFTGIYLLSVITLLLPSAKGVFKYLTLTLILLSVIFLLNEGATFDVWIESVSINHTLVALFISVPFLGVPIKSKEYLEALKQVYIRYMQNPNVFFFLTQSFTHFMAIILNVGSVSIFYQLGGANPYVQSARRLSTPLMRGFATALIWSPFFAAMALVTTYLQIEWANSVPFLLGFVILSFLASSLLEWRMNFKTADKEEVAAGTENAEEVKGTVPLQKRKLIELASFLVMIIVSLLVLEKVTSMSMVTLVIFLSFLFPMFWLTIKKRFRRFVLEAIRYATVTVPLLKKEVLLFLVAGLFSGAVAQTGFGDWIAGVLNHMYGGYVSVSLFIILTVIVASLIGFHPIMLITVYVTSLEPSAIHLSTMYFAVLLLGAWGIATSISPMTGVSHLLAHEMKEKVVNISLRWNLGYGILSLGLLLTYMVILHETGLI
ncbi:hypothetical protein [Bacillus sp. Marseille-Q3570]|uniref:hypothetical protein n=1 Tax=Bacillus sp. Marseille-Q3570 TaxID=2963522 RepID=UPI0021B7C855|nr:hypothetical protein [Bacillus sp. Marseille-Q3570]